MESYVRIEKQYEDDYKVYFKDEEKEWEAAYNEEDFMTMYLDVLTFLKPDTIIEENSNIVHISEETKN